MAKKTTRRRKRRTKRTGKSISLGNGFRLNISKSGVNLTGGISGARMSVGTSGIKSTLSVPGTGISKTKTLVSKKDVLDKFKDDDDKDDKKDKKKKPSEKAEDKEDKDKKAKDKEDQGDVTLGDEELEALKKRQEAKKRVEAIESQFETGEKGNDLAGKVLDKDIPKSFIKEGFKTGWWIAVIILGLVSLLLNPFIGGGIILVGGVLLFLEYQLPKNRAKRYFNTGIDLYKEKNYEEAIKEMEKGLLFSPEHENMLLTIGTIKFEVFDDTNGAIVHLTKVKDLYENKEGVLILSKCYFNLEQYVETIELLQAVSFKKSMERDRVLLLSRSYLLSGQPKLAIEVLLPVANEYVINKDELIEVNYWLGYAYLDDYEFEQAKIYLDLVEHQDPDYKDIKRLIENIED